MFPGASELTPFAPIDVDSMDIEDPAFGMLDMHDGPAEKVDTDFFNGARSRLSRPHRTAAPLAVCMMWPLCAHLIHPRPRPKRTADFPDDFDDDDLE